MLATGDPPGPEVQLLLGLQSNSQLSPMWNTGELLMTMAAPEEGGCCTPVSCMINISKLIFLQDFHFSKPLEKTFLSKVELEELSRQSAASGRRDGTTREPPGLSWARVTAPCSS